MRRLLVDADLTSEDGAFGLFPTRAEAAGNQCLIQAGDHRYGSPGEGREMSRPDRPGSR
jgi:hypothetical protein